MNCRPFILRKTKEEAWLGFDRQCRDRGFDGGLDFLAYYEEWVGKGECPCCVKGYYLTMMFPIIGYSYKP